MALLPILLRPIPILQGFTILYQLLFLLITVFFSSTTLDEPTTAFSRLNYSHVSSVRMIPTDFQGPYLSHVLIATLFAKAICMDGVAKKRIHQDQGRYVAIAIAMLLLSPRRQVCHQHLLQLQLQRMRVPLRNVTNGQQLMDPQLESFTGRVQTQYAQLSQQGTLEAEARDRHFAGLRTLMLDQFGLMQQEIGKANKHLCR